MIKEEVVTEDLTSDGIIDSLFIQNEVPAADEPVESNPVDEHVVDPDDFALYKKYLG